MQPVEMPEIGWSTALATSPPRLAQSIVWYTGEVLPGTPIAQNQGTRISGINLISRTITRKSFRFAARYCPHDLRGEVAKAV